MASRRLEHTSLAEEANDDQPESPNFLSDEEISRLWQDKNFSVSSDMFWFNFFINRYT